MYYFIIVLAKQCGLKIYIFKILKHNFYYKSTQVLVALYDSIILDCEILFYYGVFNETILNTKYKHIGTT